MGALPHVNPRMVCEDIFPSHSNPFTNRYVAPSNLIHRVK